MKNFNLIPPTLNCRLLIAFSALVISAFFGASCRRQPAADWPGLKQMIRERFPEVRQLSVRQLGEWLGQPDASRPLLLDARAPAEYAVSHLPGARLAADEEQALNILKGVAKERLIVVYCSVGYRSSALAQQLRQLGYTNVYNLEGSIFEWANEGRPVYQGERRVKLVHPFDEKWGAYLKRELWSALSSSSN